MGTYDTNLIHDPYTKKLFWHLGQPPSISDLLPWTKTDYNQGWKKAREATSLSPSGIHFGHYIAGQEDKVVAKINYLMANIPMLMGISPTRWWMTLNVMLEKLVGKCWVEKLRIIMLFEADFNNNNKWLGKAIMAEAEQKEVLTIEQYRSTKGKAAGIQCLNKRLFYNYIWTLWIPAALCSNDAKSCYDWIILLVAALCLCQLGVPVPQSKVW